MRNHVQRGIGLDFVAPSGGVVSGKVYIFGAFACVASTTADEGEPFNGDVEGVFELDAATNASAQAISVGGPVYWDATNKVATATATNNTLIGAATEAKVSTVAKVKVKLIQRPAA
jgi:predicted RecA/RadA family phage recombinase